MAKERGKSFFLSPFRRLVADLMYFSRAVPAVTLERRFNLAALRAARQCCMPRPSWTGMFAKAFALAARSRPELRRAYLSFPWPRLYEHPYSMACVNIERQLPNETIVVQCLIRRPDSRPLTELDGILRRHQSEPVETLRWYTRAMHTSRLPWPIRPLFWWGALNVLGRRRSFNFGTFGVSSVAAQGAGVLHLVPLLTAMLHYGLFDAAGNLDVRLTFDHRVLDGGAAARALAAVGQALQQDILDEVTRLSRVAA